MKDLFSRAGIDLTDEQIALFDRYAGLLTEYNEKFNLTAITERSEIDEKHFLDSALAARFFPTGATVIDVGTGAGFPSIPLKILRPDLRITMIDSLQKRIGFLETVIEELGLTDVRAQHARAEDFAKTEREKYDCATARAVAPLNVLAEYCLPFVKTGGLFLAYKGQNAASEALSARNAFAILGGTEPKIDFYTLPSGDKRGLIESKKVTKTPPKYPRGQNKPRLSPLG